MAQVWSTLQEFNLASVLFRLLLAVVGGGVVGYGRSRQNRPAGFRTYMLISVGAAMAVLLTLYQYEMLQTQWNDVVKEVGMKYDASRLASQVITGIGFLGAGIIIKVAHQQVSGLTTATGLFATVCMGAAAGAGFYVCVIPAILITDLILNVMSPLEPAFKRRIRNITLTVDFNSVEDIEEISQAIRDQHAVIHEIDVERSQWEGENSPSAIFVMKLSKESHSHSSMLSSVAELPCVRGVHELIS